MVSMLVRVILCGLRMILSGSSGFQSQSIDIAFPVALDQFVMSVYSVYTHSPAFDRKHWVYATV
jgi:hypothetical protein